LPLLVPVQFNESVQKNSKLLKSRKDDKVVTRMKKEIDDFKDFILPVLTEVCCCYICTCACVHCIGVRVC